MVIWGTYIGFREKRGTAVGAIRLYFGISTGVPS